MDYRETCCYTCPICNSNLKYKEVRYNGLITAQLRILCPCCGLQVEGKAAHSDKIWKMIRGGH